MTEKILLYKKNWDNIKQSRCPHCSSQLNRDVRKFTKNEKISKPMFGDGGLLEIYTDRVEKVEHLRDYMVCKCGFRITIHKYNDIQKGKESSSYIQSVKNKIRINKMRKKLRVKDIN